MIESIAKRTMSKQKYEDSIKNAKKAIAGIEKIIEQHRKTKPCKIFKKKMTRYEWELNQLYDRKRFWETRAGELEYEKKRLYP